MKRLDQKTLDHFNQFLSNPILVFNEKGLLYHNQAFQRAIQEETINAIFHNLYHDLDLTSLNLKQEVHIKNSHGNIFHFDVEYQRVIFNNTPSIVAFLTDISERVQVQKELKRIQRLRTLISEISSSILENEDLDHFYDYILRTTLKAIDKTTLGSILVVEDGYLVSKASVGFCDDIKQLKIVVEHTFAYQVTDGKLDRVVNIPDLDAVNFYSKVNTEYGDQVQIESTLTAPFYFKGELHGFINIDSLKKHSFDDEDVKSIEYIVKSIEIAITNRLLYEEKVYLSRYDNVTGLYNRHYFDDQSEFIIKKALRYHESFHVVMIDVDHLKAINDEYSHLAGDQVINRISTLIKSNVRDSDVFARYGGDEFIGIVFNAQTDEITEKFNQLNQILIKTPVQYQDQNVFTSISFGIAKFDDDGTTINDLVRVADERMYHSKKDRNS
jgi:diguanylate cyclase (GGDEF)-like protein